MERYRPSAPGQSKISGAQGHGTSNGRIGPDQRYTASQPCPICGGTDRDRRGQGTRCHGFRSGDGAWAHCAREEHAGRAPFHERSRTYAHKLRGPCPCGAEHAPADIDVRRNGRPKANGRAGAEETKGRIVATYDYRDAGGEALFQVVRFEPKGFAQRRPDGQGGWIWNLAGVALVPYRLPELRAAGPVETVWIPEGEKDVDRLRSLGLVATCNPMGAEKWRDELSPHLQGRLVVVLADNDPPGRRHARMVARSAAAHAASVKVIDMAEACGRLGLGDLPEHGDVSDVLDRGGTVEDLRRLAAEAPTWAPSAEPAAAARPTIVITTREHEVISQAVDALARDPRVFQRGNLLVTVLRDAARNKTIKRPVGSPRIALLPAPRLRELLAENADWLKCRRTRDGDPEEAAAHPPDWAVSGVAARGEWANIRPIEAIVETPTLRPDGSILDAPGYDEPTALLYEPNIDFPAIPKRPTREDARAAAGLLLGLVCDFPFAGDADPHAWLAGLLTVLTRFAIDGPCPLFAFDANAPATGKTKLADIIATIDAGRGMPRTAYPDSDEEMRKRITAIALAGDRMMLIDNVATTFGGSALDSALTAVIWRDRNLGRMEMTPELPLFTTWFVTGNNLTLRGDVLRRVVPCRLETRRERPEERTDFRIPGDLLKHVRRERPRLVAAALTLLRAHAVAGRPGGGLTPLGSFESWSDVVRAAIYWATGIDPCATREELRAADPETLARVALVEGWAELEGSDRGLTAAEALRMVAADRARYATLYDVLMELSRNDELPTPKAVGKRLNAVRGRVVNGKSLRCVPYQGTNRWRVVVADPD